MEPLPTSSSMTSPNLAKSTSETMSSPTITSGPSVLGLILGFLVPNTAVSDWINFVIIGGLFEIARRFLSLLYDKAVSLVCVKASFYQDDYSYHWVHAWLAEQPLQKSMRDVDVSTRYQATPSASGSNLGPNILQASYLPSSSGVVYARFSGIFMSIGCRTEKTGNFGSKEHAFDIWFYTSDTGILDSFIKASRDVYLASTQGSVITFTSDQQNNWKKSGSSPKVSGACPVLPPGVAEGLMKRVKEFLNSKSWYARRGIPYRLGILLHGPPGSGKTSYIRQLATILSLDVYLISLSKSGLDDTALANLINTLPETCLVVIEDIDAAFTHPMKNRDLDTGTSSGVETPGLSQSSASRVSLSGLLNAVDGLGAQEGRILMTTTNKFKSLDSALTRPGRMDIHVKFDNANKYQARELFSRFYDPPNQDLEYPDYGRMSRSAARTNEYSVGDINKLLEDSSANDLEPQAFVSTQVEELSLKFSNAIPDVKLSMASLQGYLLQYKDDPIGAVNDIGQWVKEELSRNQDQAINTYPGGPDVNASPTPPPTPANYGEKIALLAVPDAD